MKAAALLITLALLLSSPAASPDKRLLYLVSAQMPMYPRIAQTAQITGEVVASFTVDQDGSVSSVQIESGPPLLVKNTQDNIKTWKFALPDPIHQPTWEDHTTFVYKVLSDKDVPDAFSLTMKSYRHIEILAPSPERQISRSGAEQK